MRIHSAIFIALLVAACSNNNPPPPPPIQPPISGWTAFFGSAVPVPSFDFPAAPGSIQYVVQPGTAQLGQTISMTFQILGSGALGVTDPADTLPPTVHLVLWENGDNLTGQGAYETYREWCGRADITNPGQYTVSCKLDPSLWTGVFGQTPSSAAFQQLLNNLYAIGFTFGGASFYGHGDYSASGTMHFQLVSYIVQQSDAFSGFDPGYSKPEKK